ncbi:MAG TPA: GyrI-like domain-containing protein [Chitinophagaceae bacterium]|nr:GyrI-like domain-containing protein [Chitinophagaceae bacterium]
MIAKTEIIEQKEFSIAGISVRTTNQNGQSQKDIGDLWTRFMNENLLQQIHKRTSDDIYCVYTDYETDHAGFYTALLGCKVHSLTQIPDGFVGITIVAGKYQVYFLEGKFPQNVGEAWRHIWDNAIDRKYTADFDLYSADAKSFEETEVKIHLAVN